MHTTTPAIEGIMRTTPAIDTVDKLCLLPFTSFSNLDDSSPMV